MKEKVLFCWSSGKDSALGLYNILNSDKYDVESLLTTVCSDYDRISHHGVRRSLLEKQIESLKLPLLRIDICESINNEEYEKKMKKALDIYKNKNIKKVAFGDIFLEDLRKYREDNLAKVQMVALFPLWKQDTKELLKQFVALGFKAVIVSADSKFFDKSFAGRQIDEKFLDDLPDNVDPCGENGEYHSFVFDGPIFDKKVEFSVGETVLRDGYYYCDLIPV